MDWLRALFCCSRSDPPTPVEKDSPVRGPPHERHRGQAWNEINPSAPSRSAADRLQHTSVTPSLPNGSEVLSLASGLSGHRAPTNYARTSTSRSNLRPPSHEETGSVAGSSRDRLMPHGHIERRSSVSPPVPTKEGINYPSVQPTLPSIITTRTRPVPQSDTSLKSPERLSNFTVPDSGVELSYQKPFQQTGLLPHPEETDSRGRCTTISLSPQIDDASSPELHMRRQLKATRSKAPASETTATVSQTSNQRLGAAEVVTISNKTSRRQGGSSPLRHTDFSVPRVTQSDSSSPRMNTREPNEFAHAPPALLRRTKQGSREAFQGPPTQSGYASTSGRKPNAGGDPPHPAAASNGSLAPGYATSPEVDATDINAPNWTSLLERPQEFSHPFPAPSAATTERPHTPAQTPPGSAPKVETGHPSHKNAHPTRGLQKPPMVKPSSLNPSLSDAPLRPTAASSHEQGTPLDLLSQRRVDALTAHSNPSGPQARTRQPRHTSGTSIGFLENPSSEFQHEVGHSHKDHSDAFPQDGDASHPLDSHYHHHQSPAQLTSTVVPGDRGVGSTPLPPTPHLTSQSATHHESRPAGDFDSPRGRHSEVKAGSHLLQSRTAVLPRPNVPDPQDMTAVQCRLEQGAGFAFGAYPMAEQHQNRPFGEGKSAKAARERDGQTEPSASAPAKRISVQTATQSDSTPPHFGERNAFADAPSTPPSTSRIKHAMPEMLQGYLAESGSVDAGGKAVKAIENPAFSSIVPEDVGLTTSVSSVALKASLAHVTHAGLDALPPVPVGEGLQGTTHPLDNTSLAASLKGRHEPTYGSLGRRSDQERRQSAEDGPGPTSSQSGHHEGPKNSSPSPRLISTTSQLRPSQAAGSGRTTPSSSSKPGPQRTLGAPETHSKPSESPLPIFTPQPTSKALALKDASDSPHASSAAETKAGYTPPDALKVISQGQVHPRKDLNTTSHNPLTARLAPADTPPQPHNAIANKSASAPDEHPGRTVDGPQLDMYSSCTSGPSPFVHPPGSLENLGEGSHSRSSPTSQHKTGRPSAETASGQHTQSTHVNLQPNVSNVIVNSSPSLSRARASRMSRSRTVPPDQDRSTFGKQPDQDVVGVPHLHADTLQPEPRNTAHLQSYTPPVNLEEPIGSLQVEPVRISPAEVVGGPSHKGTLGHPTQSSHPRRIDSKDATNPSPLPKTTLIGVSSSYHPVGPSEQAPPIMGVRPGTDTSAGTRGSVARTQGAVTMTFAEGDIHARPPSRRSHDPPDLKTVVGQSTQHGTIRPDNRVPSGAATTSPQDQASVESVPEQNVALTPNESQRGVHSTQGHASRMQRTAYIAETSSSKQHTQAGSAPDRSNSETTYPSPQRSGPSSLRHQNSVSDPSPRLSKPTPPHVSTIRATREQAVPADREGAAWSGKTSSQQYTDSFGIQEAVQPTKARPADTISGEHAQARSLPSGPRGQPSTRPTSGLPLRPGLAAHQADGLVTRISTDNPRSTLANPTLATHSRQVPSQVAVPANTNVPFSAHPNTPPDLDLSDEGTSTLNVSFGPHSAVETMTTYVAGGHIFRIGPSTTDGSSDRGWNLLLSHVAQNAIHNSKAASSIGTCDQGTRAQAIAKITGWAQGGAPGANTLCMTGAAGSGKSTIALTMAEQWERDQTLAASFFFSSLDNTRNGCLKAIPTIAAQLALWRQKQGLRREISEAAWANSLVFTTSLSTQATKLIVEPLRSLRVKGGELGGGIILFDGVDECPDEDQEELMNVVVAIHRELEPGGLLDIPLAYHIKLSDDKEFDASEDIKHTLRIHLPKYVKMTASDLEGHIDIIAEALSGQYIYPATVIKHVAGGKRDPPWKRLNSIVTWIRAPKREESVVPHPLRTLDILYSNILLAAIRHADNSAIETGGEAGPIVLVLRAFASLYISTVLQIEPHPESINDQLLSLNNGTFNSVVCDLRSLVRVRDPAETGAIIQFYHRTCFEFLQDRRRIGENKEVLYFDDARVNSYIVKRLCDSFISSSAAILQADGLFTTNEAAWVNCTSAAFLGSFLQLTIKLKDTPRTIQRFAQRKGLEMLEGWIDRAKKHPEFAQSPLVKVALSDWRHSLDALQRKKTGELAQAAKRLVGIIDELLPPNPPG